MAGFKSDTFGAIFDQINAGKRDASKVPRDNKELAGRLADQIRWSLSAEGVTARDKIVLMALIMRSDRMEGYCYPSLAVLSEDTGLPTESISRSTNNLKRHGLIEIERRGKKRSNFYVVNWPDYY